MTLSIIYLTGSELNGLGFVNMSTRAIKVIKSSPFPFTPYIKSHRDYFDYLGNEIRLKNWEDWYKLRREELIAYGGQQILNFYGNLSEAISTTYPERNWAHHKFRQLPKGFWNEYDNHIAFVHFLEGQFYVDSLDDWYKVDDSEVLKNIPESKDFIETYSCLADALVFLYPHHKWLLWKFKKTSRTYWTNNTTKEFFEWFARENNFESWEDWYRVRSSDITASGGEPALHKETHIEALMRTFPDHDWKIWNFEHIPSGFWLDKKNQRDFIDFIGQHRIGIKNWEDWYQFNKSILGDFGGASLLHHYQHKSFYDLLKAVYPEHEWDEIKFQKQAGVWSDMKMQREFFDQISKKLDIKRWDDWYKITGSEVVSHGGQTLLNYYNGSLSKALRAVYPDTAWNFKNVFNSSWKSQGRLFKVVQEVLPNINDSFVNYVHPTFRFSATNTPMEFDIFVPSLKLAIEYHGKQHYESVDIYKEERRLRVQRDEEKRVTCYKAGVSLIEIPYWFSWGASKESLKEILLKERPDLIKHVS